MTPGRLGLPHLLFVLAVVIAVYGFTQLRGKHR
jgi:hypothetical protein